MQCLVMCAILHSDCKIAQEVALADGPGFAIPDAVHGVCDRKGAYRDERRRSDMPQHFKVYDGAYPHFVTSTIVFWIPVFCRDDYFRVLTDSLGHCVEHKGLVVHGYVVMPNHFHAVLSQSEGRLSDVIRDMKKHTAKAIAAKLEADGRITWLNAMRRAAGHEGGVRVWDEAFHPEQVYSEQFCRQKLDYMHNNPVRAGYVSDPSEWTYSSAGLYYRDDESAVPVAAIEW